MRVSTTLGALALLQSSSSSLLVAAMPAAGSEVDDAPEDAAITPAPQPPLLELRADPTAPWVSVDDMGRPAETLTPSLTTIDGSVSVIDGAPHDITATVFTQTFYGVVSTSTGTAPNPSATSSNKEGGFARCFNEDGDMAPFCDPATDSTLYEGTTYYVTWDPDYFNNTLQHFSNATWHVSLRLDYFNHTTEHDDVTGDWLKLDETDSVPADYGVYALPVKGDYLRSRRPHNITITLLTNLEGNSNKNETGSVLPLVFSKREGPTPPEYRIPDNQDIIIALPVTFGSLIIIMVGLFFWHRKTRRINIANIMSRARRGGAGGYSGRKTRRNIFRRAGGGDKFGPIQLTERSHPELPGSEYRDDLPPAAPGGRTNDVNYFGPSRPRRDSDLDSLVDSPVRDTFHGQESRGAATGSNAFRDELRRQDEQRRTEGGRF